MKRRFVLSLSVQLLATLILYSCFSPDAGAGVYQQAGMADTVIGNGEAVCRGCHGNAEQFPDPTLDTAVGDRHHVLYGTPVSPGSVAPYPASGDTFDCATCHNISGVSGGELQVDPLKDCALCHGNAEAGGLVHHVTDLAQGPDCQACHGSFVDNMDDGHYMPAYAPSTITPAPGRKFNSDPGINGEGSCDFCHAGEATNYATHHEDTGFGADQTTCLWCHWNNPPDTSDPYEMRACENCHSVYSLHNVQLDSNGDGMIAPGIESGGYGHNGNNSDCWGCHGYSMATSAAAFTSSLIPTVHGLSASVFTAGKSTSVTMIGNGFRPVVPTQDPQQPYQESVAVALLGEIQISPDTVSDGSMTFTVPATLAVGNYGLRALRVSLKSNLMAITVKPKAQVSSVTSRKGRITISGAGFGVRPKGMDDYLYVDLNGSRLSVVSWADNKIVAVLSKLPTSFTLTVKGVFGSASYRRG